jgi:hypothetical protein
MASVNSANDRCAWAEYSLALGICAALLLMLAGGGCLTTSATTLQENSAAYRELLAFLKPGITTRDQVLERYGQPLRLRQLPDGEEWQYWRYETVVVNPYSDGHPGAEMHGLRNAHGFQHTVQRRFLVEIRFDQEGLLAERRIIRDGELAREPGRAIP